MPTLTAILTALMLFAATPVVAVQCKRSCSDNEIDVKAVDRENRKFIADDINLRVGPGVRYCLKTILADGLSKSVDVIGEFEYWRLLRKSKNFGVSVIHEPVKSGIVF